MDISTKESPELKCALCNCRTAHLNPDKTLNTENYRELAFRVSNGSIMTVGFCQRCVLDAAKDDLLFDKIMESVIDGWQKELEHEKCTEEQKKKYADQFYNLKLVGRYQGTEQPIEEDVKQTV